MEIPVKVEVKPTAPVMPQRSEPIKSPVADKPKQEIKPQVPKAPVKMESEIPIISGEELIKKTGQKPAMPEIKAQKPFEAKQVSFQEQENDLPEKAYMKKMPEDQKEKLQASNKVEQEQKRKFMEDVEKWAASSDKEA